MTAEPTSQPQDDQPQTEEQRLALRRIAQKLKQLREELDRLNRQPDDRARRQAR
jgi:hypothetical protein